MRLASPNSRIAASVLFLGTALFYASSETRQGNVDFQHDVLPILKAHCLQCHGESCAMGDLSLVTREALLKGGLGGPAVVAGKSGESLLIQRVLGQGGKPRMPMGFAPLTGAQIDTLKVWIDGGALASGTPKAKHWAFVPPAKPALPPVKNAVWSQPIDRFVLARLERERLKPSPPADRNTLLRRVTLDLTGLPPTPDEIRAFLADKRPDAYERVVDRLLASPHYGERMALPWLDAARYADSNGFQQDGDTYQYVWRDWVVRALNRDMPFDRFAIEQLAGDLLPRPTQDQVLATAFNRCHMINGEGGAIPEEQRNVILFDRVDVTATTFLGLTMACARCHDHKYDPISQEDYYRFLAFFNNVPETGVPEGSGQYRIAPPWMYAGSPQELAKQTSLEGTIASTRGALEKRMASPEFAAEAVSWRDGVRAQAKRADAAPVKISSWFLTSKVAKSFDAAYDQDMPLPIGPENQRVEHAEWVDGKVYPLTGDNTAFYLSRTIQSPDGREVLATLGSDDAIKLWLNGKLILANKVTRGALADQERVRLLLKPGENALVLKIVNGGGPGGFYFKLHLTELHDDVLATLNDEKAARAAFLEARPPEEAIRLKRAEAELQALRLTLPRVMVMSDAMPRKTFVYSRGNYTAPLDEVSPGVPETFSQLPANAPKNRLELAKWIVSPENPLTARVQVNRLWQMFFGNGFVKASENFGLQSDRPSHPELLDWLAREFIEKGWSVKRMVRQIVTSQTYRQSSKTPQGLRKRDPENRLLARGARFRMASPILRDVALASSGLLDRRIGGKPVYPYQPKGIWDGLAITLERDFTYPQSKGADLYRRSLYTFWRRTVAPGNMFDASTRNVCTVRPSLTSTPLHALTMLNDPTWVEAGRELAQRVMARSSAVDDRLNEAFQRVCGRRLEAAELAVLRSSFSRVLKTYQAAPKEAERYLGVGESKRNSQLDPAEHAAYAAICLAIYNLDEAMTRE